MSEGLLESLEVDGCFAFDVAWTNERFVMAVGSGVGLMETVGDTLGLRVGHTPLVTATWAPDLAPRSQRGRAVSNFRSSAVDSYSHQTYRAPLMRVGVADESRILLFDGRRFLACVTVQRTADRDVFARPDIGRMEAAVMPWVIRLTTARAMAEDLHGDHAVALVRDGQLTHLSESARDWMTSSAQRELLLAVAGESLESTTGLASAMCGRVVVRGQHLRGQGGDRVLMTLSPTEVPLLRLAADLSPRQFTVASYAASGATAGEIAATMGCSVHTVRRHLKVVYRVLQVSSRVELSRAMISAGVERHESLQ